MLDVFHQRWVYKQIIEEHVKYKYDGSIAEHNVYIKSKGDSKRQQIIYYIMSLTLSLPRGLPLPSKIVWR